MIENQNRLFFCAFVFLTVLSTVFGAKKPIGNCATTLLIPTITYFAHESELDFEPEPDPDPEPEPGPETLRSMVEHLLALLKEKYLHAAEVKYLKKGGESAIFEVSFLAPKTTMVIKLPLRYESERQIKAIKAEKKIIRAAKRKDRQNAKYLVQFFGMVYLGTKRIPGLSFAKANLGSLSENLMLFGPGIAAEHPEYLLRAWKQMALALKALHGVGHVHRDIKPKNFIVTRLANGQLHFQLIDFGLAAPEGSYPVGLEVGFSGTSGYMSENQLMGGEARNEDDLYSLLTTFSEMLTGKSIWRLDPQFSGNHIKLVPVNEFGTYPVLTALPDQIASQVHPILVDLVSAGHKDVGSLIQAIDHSLRQIRKK